MDHADYTPRPGQRLTLRQAGAFVRRYECELAALGVEAVERLRGRSYRLHDEEPVLYPAEELVRIGSGRHPAGGSVDRVRAGHVAYERSATIRFAFVRLMVEWDTERVHAAGLEEVG